MANPWLAIPLEDYEGHMSSAEVQQLDTLANLFDRVLRFTLPESVAVLGIAGGNGLDRISPTVTKRVCGIDINPAYVDAVRQRHSDRPGLELYCADLAAQTVRIAPVQLVHAALIFEHAGLDGTLENALAMVEPGGRISVVLQMACPQAPEVSVTPFSSLQSLGSHFHVIEPVDLCTRLAAEGFRRLLEEQIPLPGGKSFWLAVFGRE